ncbi:MAG: Holliday junction branch migration protein RuvA [Planctomycetota bacterium]
MYHHLRGKVLDLGPTSLVIEAGGVGYDVRIPLSTFERVQGSAETCIYTHLYVREDDLRLYGFATLAERDLFRLLLSVNGVGPSIALAALSSLAPAEVARALAAGDLDVLQRVKGVGKKLAERLAVELRDRAERLLPVLGVSPSAAARVKGPLARALSREAEEAVAALLTLGFDKKAAEERARGAVERLRASEPEKPVPVEKIIRECLRAR